MSGRKAGETHGEVSLTQGELSGSLGKAGKLLELGFFSLQMGVVSVEGDGLFVLISEVCKKDSGRRSSSSWRGRRVSGAGGSRW